MTPSRRRIVWIAVFCLIVLAAIAGWRLQAGPQVATVEVAEGPFVYTVIATGRVAPTVRVSVGVLVNGRVAATPVAEGSAVAAGQLLVQLEDRDQRAALAQAEAALAQAEAKYAVLARESLPQSREGERQAQTTLGEARRNFARQQQLYDQGFISAAQLDAERAKLDIAESQFAASQSRRNSQQSGASLQLARADIAAARAQLAVAQAKLAETRLVAPSAGVLLTRSVETGDIVQPGKEALLLAIDGPTQIRLDVDERYLAGLRLGQPVSVVADAWPRNPFEAKVVYLSRQINNQKGTVEVRLDVARPPAFLRTDMTVSAEIEVARRARALTVPQTVVHDADGPAPWVLRVEDGVARRRAVGLGVVAGGKVEVVAGLKAADRLVPAGAAVVDGMRVRAGEGG